jgi:pyridoxine 5'-phosphate synthase PdxJ
VTVTLEIESFASLRDLRSREWWQALVKASDRVHQAEAKVVTRSRRPERRRSDEDLMDEVGGWPENVG